MRRTASKYFDLFCEHAGTLWTEFREVANPRAEAAARPPADLERQAQFESIDYYKPYPTMYMNHLRGVDGTGAAIVRPSSNDNQLAEGNEDPPPEEEDDVVNMLCGRRNRSATAPPLTDDPDAATQRSSLNSVDTAVLRLRQVGVTARNVLEEVTSYDSSSRNSTLRWVLHVIIAIAVGLIASGVTYTVAFLEEWRRSTLQDIVLSSDYAKSTGYFFGLLFWIGTGCFMVSIAAAVVVFYEPAAGGSGIPDVIAYLNGVLKPKVVNLRTFSTKSISCVLAVAGGLPVGVEAPLIHLGAIAGAGVTQGRSRTLGCQTKLFQAFRNNKDRRDFITAGAACGVSAAFGAPIGGLLFVMEEVSSFWDHSASGQVFLASMISFSVIALINSLAENDHTIGRVSNAAAILFEVNIRIPLNLLSIIPALFLGALSGLLAVIFTKLNILIIRWRRRTLRPKAWKRVSEPVVIIALFSFVMYVLALMPDCIPTVPIGADSTLSNSSSTREVEVWGTENATHLSTFTCDHPGSYSPLATLTIGSGKETIRHLFHRRSVDEFPAGDVLLFFLLYFGFACWASGTFVATGLVVPTLVMGATFGRLFGLFVVHAFSEKGPVPNAYLSSESWMDPGVFALIGAGALLGGINRMTMSICVIMVELSGELHYLLPIMVAIVMSKATADWLCEPLYHHMLHSECVPYLPLHTPKQFEQLTAADVMRTQVVCLRVREKTSTILHALRTSTHHAFPILEEIEDGNPSPQSSAHDASFGVGPVENTSSLTNNNHHSSKELGEGGSASEQEGDAHFPHRVPTLHDRHRGGGSKRMRFVGVATREDIQVFLSLPEFQQFRKPTPTTIPSGAGSATDEEPESPGTYRQRVADVMRRVNNMSWVQWMQHQTSLFFVIGDKQWHLNWTRTNAPLVAPKAGADGSSPAPFARGRKKRRGVGIGDPPPVSDEGRNVLQQQQQSSAAHRVDVPFAGSLPGSSAVRVTEAPPSLQSHSPFVSAASSSSSSSIAQPNPFFVDERTLPTMMDLSLIVNRSPWVIPPFFNLNMAYATFRTMGLRHMIVADDGTVKGIITRKDLLLDSLREKVAQLRERLHAEEVEERAKRAVAAASSAYPNLRQQQQLAAVSPTTARPTAAAAAAPSMASSAGTEELLPSLLFPHATGGGGGGGAPVGTTLPMTSSSIAEDFESDAWVTAPPPPPPAPAAAATLVAADRELSPTRRLLNENFYDAQ